MLCIRLLLLIGVVDDRFDLPVMPRRLVQAGVAGIRGYVVCRDRFH
ncbi:hypothetical protein [Candidatus Erwinia dacicola]|uniref:Undecaprenyl-phosphate N-acetylglucosaminyl 1-phosphate transferase domain protein n=1 Tax=Candidatus Erwinia dacicola TaxID=252393 RepID=A0A328TN64_9GAMM|nr:hypothetical protein [Candidatus Erwinia dacicola]RAP71670.1 undecaprenyl-phosphate N-acetylglucosaminyl 1-phosphate transferase domain protein [Candidatus Erwinia dacicola]